MSDNTFTVDLGKIKLTDTQRNNINAAIQRAVAGELANFELKEQLVLVPVTSKINGRFPWIRGIIADVLAPKIQEQIGA